MRRVRRAGVWLGLALGTVVLASDARAEEIEWSRPIVLSRGVTMKRAKVSAPREIRYLAVRIDLKTPGLFLVGSDRAPDYGKPLAENSGLYAKLRDGTKKKIEPAVIRTRREPVREFMARAVKGEKEGGRGLDMALAFIASPTSLPYDETHANPIGLVVSEGKVVSERKSGAPLLVVRKNGTAAIVDALSASEYADVQVANTCATHIRKEGKDVVLPERNTPDARLAIGVSKEGRYLWVLSADNGKAFARKTGASHHDLNAAFASLGVPDAFCAGSGAESAISVRDQKTGAIRTLNICPDGLEPGKCAAAIGVCYRAPEPEKPAGPEQISARIVQPRLNASRDRATGEVTLRGQVRVSASSDLARFKRPVLSVSALFDVDGMWRMYDVICSDQKVCYGYCLDHGQNPAQVSNWQPEVGKESWTSILFGDVKRGIFAGYRIPADRAKLLGYRLELWQNGGLVDSFDSDRAGLRRIGAPDDWFEKGKYPGKIVYRWPPPKE